MAEDAPKEVVETKQTRDEPKDRRPGGGFHKHALKQKREQYKKNVKTDYEQLPESSDPDEIRKQVEFYLSDSNLSYDDYMRSLIGDDNKPVDIKTIHNFKRMRRFQPYSAVVEALKESTTLNVVNEDQVQRKTLWVKPEPDNEFNDPTIPKSIYAKGFGEEGATTQFDIESFFAPYGPVSSIRLRRLPDGKFKSSVFVEFDTEELQKQFLELEEKPKWEGEELKIMSKEAYVNGKAEDIKAGKIKPYKGHNYKQYSHPKPQRDSRNGKDRKHRDSQNGRGSRRDRDDWKSRRDDFQNNGFKEPKGEVKEEQEEPSKKRERDEENTEESNKKSKAEADEE